MSFPYHLNIEIILLNVLVKGSAEAHVNLRLLRNATKRCLCTMHALSGILRKEFLMPNLKLHER